MFNDVFAAKGPPPVSEVAQYANTRVKESATERTRGGRYPRMKYRANTMTGAGKVVREDAHVRSFNDVAHDEFDPR